MKKQENLVLILVAVVAVLTLCFIVIPSIDSQTTSQQLNQNQAQDLSYVSKYFNPDTVNTLNIVIDENVWDVIVNNPTAKKYVPCTIELNGDIYSNIGMKTNGDYGSLLSLAEVDEKSNRYSLKFNADQYEPGMTFNGLNMFVIRNFYQDSSFSAEYLSLELAACLGLSVPAYSFVAVYINGEYFGLYLMIECVDKSYVDRNYPNQSVQIYRPVSTYLEYGGGLLEDYSAIWKTAILGTPTNEEKEQFVDALKHLYSEDIALYVDIYDIIAYFALQTASVNCDSFVNKNNYFVINTDEGLSLLPWDLDQSFSFNDTHCLSGFSVETIINYPIDSPTFVIDENGDKSLKHYPLLSSVLSSDTYREQYHELLEMIATEFLGDTMSKRLDEIDSLIDEYVKADPTKFVTYSEYKESIGKLKTFGYLRAESILGQLNGTIPSTWETQVNSPNLILVSE